MPIAQLVTETEMSMCVEPEQKSMKMFNNIFAIQVMGAILY